MAVTTINIDSQVLTFANLAAFPVTGTVKTIYIAEDTNFQYYWDGSQYVQLTADINIPANLIFYATTAPSSVAGYEKLVISPDDPDYDNPAVDVPTGAITTTAQLVGEQIADANIFAGNPGVINISTIGEIRRTSGTGTAKFYFEIYQRTSLGAETLRGTSNLTLPISGAVYQQFQVDCLFNNGTWLTTDRVVIKFYADRVAGGSNPNYDFLFGGANPVRTLFPISAQLLLNVPIAIGITGVTGGVTNQVLITDGSGKLGQSELKTVNSNSLLGSGDVSVGTVTSIATAGLLSGGTITSSGTITTSINTNRLVGRSTAGVGVMEEITIGSGLTLSGGTLTAGGGITIGTTAIASGTVNRILFEGASNVVQQDSTFVWNNTDKRLILGTEAVADTNSRLVVIGKGTGTNTTFAVHNSTGTNNALVVRDDGRVGIGTNTPSNQFQINGVTNRVLSFQTDGVYQFPKAFGDFYDGGLLLRDTASGIVGNNAYFEVANTNTNSNIAGGMINLRSATNSMKMFSLSSTFVVSPLTANRGYLIFDNRAAGNTGGLIIGSQNSGSANTSIDLRGGNNHQLGALSQSGILVNFFGLGSSPYSETMINGATNNASLAVRGRGTTSSTFGLQVHDSTGTNNSLIVRDDTKIGIGTSTFGSDDIVRISGLGGTGFQYTITNRSAGTGAVVNRFFSNIGEGRILKYGGSTPVLTGFSVGDFGLWNDASGGRLVFTNATNNAIIFHTNNVSTPRLSIQGNGNILVGTTTDVATSILTVESTTKGILIPRMTAAERAAISSPANGLLVIQTDATEGLYRYELSTTSWIFIG